MTSVPTLQPKIGPVEKAAYRMPHVYKGQNVLWFDGGVMTDDNSCAAVVCRVDARSVWLHIHVPDSNVLRIKECVRHASDPNVKDAEKLSDGVWDFCEK